MMDFQKAREQFKILAERYRNGQITGEDFADSVDALAIIDDQGREWKIGLQSGSWYRRVGKEWVEDVPPTTGVRKTGPTAGEIETTRKVRNRLLMIGLLVLIGVFCLGSFYFAQGGPYFSLDIFGDSGVDTSKGDEALSGDSGGQGGGEGNQAIKGTAQTTATSEENNGNVVVPEASQTAAATQPPSQPTETPTAQPPPPIAPPQVWRSLVNIELNTPGNLTGDWSAVKQKAWEYEIITYKDKSALFIQFESPEELLYSGGEQVVDIDRAVTLALPDPDGRVDIVCRWQNNSGYALSLTRERWKMVKIEDGNRIVLEDGRQPDAFRQGGYASFRLRCVASQLAAWAEDELLTVEKDFDYTSGTTGLRFDPTGEIGLVYIARDQLRTHLIGRETATVADTIRLGLLDVTVTQDVFSYPILTESAYLGQPLVGLNIVLSNKDGDKAVLFTSQTFYLVKDGVQVSALGFVPSVAGDVKALGLPVTLEPGQTAAGEVFFAGINGRNLESGWQLVVDLRYQALGEARFVIK